MWLLPDFLWQIPSFSQHRALTAWLCSLACATGRHRSSPLEREGLGPRHLHPPELPSVTPPVLHSNRSTQRLLPPGTASQIWHWGALLVGFHEGLRPAACGVRGMLMLQGWRDAGGGVLFAASTRSPVSRSVARPTAAVCRNQQRGGRWIGGIEGEADK